MNERMIIVFLGAMLYAIGVIAVNIFIEPVHRIFLMHPAAELLSISAGVFFLSTFFWGRLSYLLLLIAGLFLGGLFPQHPFYVALSSVPLLFALWGGSLMGENAWLDMMGKGNFFDDKLAYFESAIAFALLALAIGFYTPGIRLGTAAAFAEGVLRSAGVI